MASTKVILVSIHGKRCGLSQDGQLVVDGKTVVTQNDTGLMHNSIQPAPTTKTVANTMTIAELATRLIVATPTATGATAAYTLPTGALIDAGFNPPLNVDNAFDWHIMNLAAAAADTITITVTTGHTIVGNPIVQSSHATTGGITGNAAHFRTRKTATNVYVTYRVA